LESERGDGVRTLAEADEALLEEDSGVVRGAAAVALAVTVAVGAADPVREFSAAPVEADGDPPHPATNSDARPKRPTAMLESTPRFTPEEYVERE